jgi:hypothetical protein
MSNHLKSSLLAATAAVVASASPAYAQLVYPTADIHGAGASSVQDMWPREANCVGGFKPTGTTTAENAYTVNADDTVSSRNLGNASYAGTGTPATFVCASTSIQPNITVHYIAVGSGGGRKILAASSFTTGYAANGIKLPNGTTAAPANPDKTVFGSDVTLWDNAHYALSDSPLDVTDSTQILATNHADAKAMIQIPLYVLPVAVAYNPIYAYKSADHTKALSFDVTGLASSTVAGATTTANGGLRLSKVAYCNIFNGYITNWNDARIAATNWEVDAKGAASISKTTKKPILRALYDKTNDLATRWAAEGAPIRLVGRLDKSGTTDIFSRHLNNACTDSLGTSANKFTGAAESLPFDITSGIDLREFRGDTNYKPGTGASSLAGTTQTLNGFVYKNGVEGFVKQTKSGFSGTSEGVTVALTGTNGSGKYMVASGGGNVRDAVNAGFASTNTALKDFFGRAVFTPSGSPTTTPQTYRTTVVGATSAPDAGGFTTTTTTVTYFLESDDSVYGSIATTKSTDTTVADVIVPTGADVTTFAATTLASGSSIPGALITSADGTLLFNGKIGYIAADTVKPALGAVLSAAALEIGSSYANGTGKKPAFAMPNAVTAQAAFGKTVLPPESTSAGKYSPGATGTIVRSNPADWYNALYAAGSSLANPAVGYPMTGTTQFITGTCFKNPDIRNAVTAFLTASLGKTLVDSKNAKISKTLFTGIKIADQGIRYQYNFAPLNTAWTTAIYNTFLSPSVTKDAGVLGLYIQAGLPGKGFATTHGLTVGTGVISAAGATDGKTLPTTNPYKGTTVKAAAALSATLTEAAPNPSCTAGLGL